MIADTNKLQEQLQQAQQRIAQLEAQLAAPANGGYHNFFEASPMGIFQYRLEPDGRLVFVNANPAANRILGFDARQFIGQTIEEAFPPLADTDIPAQYRRVAQTGATWQTEQVAYDDNQGIAGAFEVHAFQIAPNEMAALFLDMTERKQTEVQLRDVEERFRVLVEESSDILFILSQDGLFEYVSPNVLNIVGYTAAELLGQPFADIIQPDDLEVCWTFLQTVLTTGQPQSGVEYRVIHKNGSQRWHSASANLSQDQKGNPTFFGISRDITAQKEATAERERLQSLIENSSDFIGLADFEGKPLYINPAGMQMTGVTDADLGHINIGEFLFPEDQPFLQETIIPTVMQKGRWEGEFRFRHYKTGASLPIYYSVFVVLDSQTKQPIALGTVTRDIRAQKEADAEREQLYQQLIEAQQAAIAELSTPIIPIMDRIIILPLVGNIDSHRARDITRGLLAGISRHRARIVIVDITGVSVVDSGVAGHLNKAIQAARLKGAEAIVTGISDAVAETIVDLGIDWSMVDTLSDLQSGLAAAMQRIRTES